MSMSLSIFTCDRCDFRASEDIVWGRFYYQLSDGSLIPLERELGWCSSCKTLAPVERLSINNAIHDEIQSLKVDFARYEAELLNLENRSFFIKCFMSSKKKEEIKKNFAYTRQVLKEKMELVNILSSRKTPPRCLICSSDEVISYEFPSISIDEPPGKHYLTGFIHPDCGGNIMISNSGIRLIMQMKRRSYSTEGVFITEWYENNFLTMLANKARKRKKTYKHFLLY